MIIEKSNSPERSTSLRVSICSALYPPLKKILNFFKKTLDFQKKNAYIYFVVQSTL